MKKAFAVSVCMYIAILGGLTRQDSVQTLYFLQWMCMCMYMCTSTLCVNRGALRLTRLNQCVHHHHIIIIKKLFF
jgi:hypothetical protein